MNKNLETALNQHLSTLEQEGRAKGQEHSITGIKDPNETQGRRYLLEDYERSFIKMNSNDYLGLATHRSLIEAAEKAAWRYGVGPGAVRFISGTQHVHKKLEHDLAAFHARKNSIIFNSAYAAVLSTINALTTKETAILSDELNHNCIINGIRLANPKHKAVYKHLDVNDLDQKLTCIPSKCKRVLVITDGVFSMRGTHAPLNALRECLDAHDKQFEEGITLIVDDSHGVAAFGETGRGTEELTQTQADVLIGTLGKAFGVNGGYVTGSQTLTTFLREMSPMYIYSNPIGPAEAAALIKSVELVQSTEGKHRLLNLKARTQQFQAGLRGLGLEFLRSQHPITPLMIRDTSKTKQLIQHLFDQSVLATGIVYPVVPKGDESIRFQINANLTEQDVHEVLQAIRSYA